MTTRTLRLAVPAILGFLRRPADDANGPPLVTANALPPDALVLRARILRDGDLEVEVDSAEWTEGGVHPPIVVSTPPRARPSTVEGMVRAVLVAADSTEVLRPDADMAGAEAALRAVLLSWTQGADGELARRLAEALGKAGALDDEDAQAGAIASRCIEFSLAPLLAAAPPVPVVELRPGDTLAAGPVAGIYAEILAHLWRHGAVLVRDASIAEGGG